MITISSHRHTSRLNSPVGAEFSPAHLHIDPHHQIWFVRWLARSLHPFTPFPLERHAAQHSSFTRPDRRASNGFFVRRRVPEAREHVDTAQLKLGGLGIFVLVHHVLIERFSHQQPRFWLHPRRDKRRQLPARIPIKNPFIRNKVSCI